MYLGFVYYSETCLNQTYFGLKPLFGRQVVGLDRLNSLKFTILGLNLMFSVHRISV